MKSKFLLAAIWAGVCAYLALLTLYPALFLYEQKQLDILTFDTATLREQLVTELEKIEPNATIPKLNIPDWYSVHMRKLCQGNWVTTSQPATSLASKQKDFVSASCETPGALTSWIFRYGWVLIAGTYSYKPSQTDLPRYRQPPFTTLFPYNDYSTHHMGVPASLLFAAALIAVLDLIVFLHAGAAKHTRRCGWVVFVAVALQFASALFAAVAALSIADMVRAAVPYRRNISRGLIFDMEVSSGTLQLMILWLAAAAALVSAILAMLALVQASDGFSENGIALSDDESVIAIDARTPVRQPKWMKAGQK